MSPSALFVDDRRDSVRGGMLWETAAAPRRRGLVKAAKDEDLAALSWLVAILASFVMVGIYGAVTDHGIIPITLQGAPGAGANEAPAVETTMAELQAMEEQTEVVQEEVLEVPEIVEPVQAMEQFEDIPEIAEALVTEDVFIIPAAPKIETALRPVDPVVKPKPEVKRTPAPRPATRTASTAAPSRTGGATGMAGGGGGGGGNGASGSGGKGKFPAPPYPSFARSRGMQGTCSLSIRVAPSGSVESVSVSRSTGFSDLDSHAVSWVRRNWRWPVGASRSYVLPVVFRLR